MTKNNNDGNEVFTIALCGNPNSGKTTLFNALTGSNQKVGNWPGVTVERKSGVYKKNASISIVDTPGIYSLQPFTPDEKVAVGYLTQNKPDLIINVVDSTNLERNLLLTTQLLELDCPLVVALNMSDEAKAKGININAEILKDLLGCKFFFISASKNEGLDSLMNYCSVKPKKRNKPLTFGKTENKIKETEQRYETISRIIESAVEITPRNKAASITDKIDKIVLNKWLAFPIFFTVMSLVFYLSVSGLGGLLANIINNVFTPWLKNVLDAALIQTNVDWLRSLIVDGIVGGVLSVVGFVPQIMILFGCISVLEASGYMSRIAFITDRLLNKIGLGGRSFVSIILGCGCSVPAITATRAIKNVKERNCTITLTPFMPCSAKLAIIAFFTSYLLNGSVLFAISFYLTSILSVIAGGLLLKFLSRKKQTAEDAFIMELPEYRAPTLTNVVKQMTDRGKAFLIKAGTIILLSSIILWFLQRFNFKLETATADTSILSQIGKFISPIFIPLGWGDKGYCWQYSVATLTGISAKETVVTTLEMLLSDSLQNSISPLGAYSFVTYNILTVPCAAAISASFTEQGGFKNGIKSVAFQIVFAYAVSLMIYQTGTLAKNNASSLLITAIVLLTAATIVFAIISLIRKRNQKNCLAGCGNCKNCGKYHE